MDANNTTKKINQVSTAKREILLNALASAKKTRKKVREKIRKGNLDEVPQFLSEALDQ